MTTQQGHTPVEVTVVHAPACHYCEDAEVALRDLAEQHAIDVRVVEIDSPEGLRLVATHRPAMNPLVLVDGVYFSSGRLPRKKLVRLIEAPAAARGRWVVGRFPKER